MPKAPKLKAKSKGRIATTGTASTSSSKSKSNGTRPPPQPKFDYDLAYENLNLRERPELYRIGVGEQGVFAVQPYKSELLPLWKFANPILARTSSTAIYEKFVEYREGGDFVGCDMARKYLQMGFTRSRRYANHKGGKKYESELGVDGKEVEVPRGEEDQVKAESASIFKAVLEKVKIDEKYLEMRERHRNLELVQV